MNFDQVQPSRLFVAILKCLGLWRLDNQWETIYRAYSYILHFLFTFLTIASMWAGVVTAKDFDHFNESLYMSLTEAGLLAKVINIFHLNKEAVHFFRLVEDEVFCLNNSEEMEIFKRAHRVYNIVGRFYICASLGVIVSAFIVVAIGQKWVLPFPAWMPFDIESEYFWYAYSFQMIGMIVTCLTNVSLDMLPCYFLHHLSLVYQVIGHRLANIGFDLDGASNDVDVNKLVLNNFKEIVKVHELVKRITNNCERFMSFPFCMQVLLSALVLCFTGYQLTSTSPMDDPGHFIGMVDFLIVIGLQIFLPCYYANQITLQSGRLSEAVYNSNWVVLPQKSKRIVYLYMEFVKKPVYVRAGNFLNIGVPIFAKTMNNAYSCFAVLMRMKY